MNQIIDIGLLGLGTVGTGVVNIINSPKGRHPLVSSINISRIAVRDINRPRSIEIDSSILTCMTCVLYQNLSKQVVE